AKLFILLIPFCLGAQCPVGDYVVQTQQEVDDFAILYPDCTELPAGLFIISDSDSPSDITNLSGLSNLSSIGGVLVVSDQVELTSLAGLSNLSTLGGALIIQDNTGLTTLSGLDNMSTVGQEVQISGNEMLETVGALTTLTTIEGSMLIADNPLLPSLAGLQALSDIGGDLTVAFNSSLTSLDGLAGLSSIGGSLVITDHAALTSVNGLSNLSSMSGFLQITYNQALTSLTGIGNIDASTIDQLFIESNANLSDCAVQSICNYLEDELDMASVLDNAMGCGSPEEVIEACTLVLTTELAWKHIELYPNPTTGNLQLNNIVAERVDVYNLQGQCIIQHQRPGKELLLHNLPTGMYYLQIWAGAERYGVRIIKK
ncbi:MAG: T9SS type A sorting domain-containing protein, partial [Bacteroidota bacterium]